MYNWTVLAWGHGMGKVVKCSGCIEISRNKYFIYGTYCWASASAFDVLVWLTVLATSSSSSPSSSLDVFVSSVLSVLLLLDAPLPPDDGPALDFEGWRLQMYLGSRPNMLISSRSCGGCRDRVKLGMNFLLRMLTMTCDDVNHQLPPLPLFSFLKSWLQ